MTLIFVIFRFFNLVFCAGCAGTCAGFVQGFDFEKSLKITGLMRLVQGVHGLEKIPLRVRAGAGARTHESARTWIIFQNPCTPCTVINNLLKKRENFNLKPCTNPAHYPAHPAQN